MTDSYKIRLGQLNGDGRLDVAGVGWGRTPSACSTTTAPAACRHRSTYSAVHGGYEDFEIGDVTATVAPTSRCVRSGLRRPKPECVAPARQRRIRLGGRLQPRLERLPERHSCGRRHRRRAQRRRRELRLQPPGSSIGVFAQTASGTLGPPSATRATTTLSLRGSRLERRRPGRRRHAARRLEQGRRLSPAAERHARRGVALRHSVREPLQPARARARRHRRQRLERHRVRGLQPRPHRPPERSGWNSRHAAWCADAHLGGRRERKCLARLERSDFRWRRRNQRLPYLPRYHERKRIAPHQRRQGQLVHGLVDNQRHYLLLRGERSQQRRRGGLSNELSATPTNPDTTPPSKPGSLKSLIAGTSQLVLD